MKKLVDRGVLISFNMGKGFYEVQKIDDVDNFKEEHGIDYYIPNVINDHKARTIAKNLGLVFLDAENPNKVDRFFEYNGDNMTIQFDKYGSEGRNLGELFDWLGEEAGVVQCNEIEQFYISDDCGNLFIFDNQDEKVLAREGIIELKATGETVEDYKDSHEDFYNWFFNIKKETV